MLIFIWTCRSFSLCFKNQENICCRKRISLNAFKILVPGSHIWDSGEFLLFYFLLPLHSSVRQSLPGTKIWILNCAQSGKLNRFYSLFKSKIKMDLSFFPVLQSIFQAGSHCGKHKSCLIQSDLILPALPDKSKNFQSLSQNFPRLSWSKVKTLKVKVKIKTSKILPVFPYQMLK